MAEISLVQAVNLALARAMADDPTVLVLGEDVGIDGGVFRVTDGSGLPVRGSARTIWAAASGSSPPLISSQLSGAMACSRSMPTPIRCARC